jgi:nucleoside-triphosphatase
MKQAIEKCDIVVVDEIGKMELFSAAFREAIFGALDSGKRIIGTIMLQSHPWADKVKQDPRVNMLIVSRSKHDQILQELLVWLRR